MSRKSRVLDKCQEIVEDGTKPSAEGISEELSWAEQDIHRLLNVLEKEDKVETYTRKVLGRKRRMVSIYRK
jgi:hypothetical protein